jgi:hypothetical protein
MIFSCRDAAELASKAIDQRLPLKQRVVTRTHLLICAHCRRFRRQIGLIGVWLDQPANAVSDSTRLSDEARTRIQSAIRMPP